MCQARCFRASAQSSTDVAVLSRSERALPPLASDLSASSTRPLLCLRVLCSRTLVARPTDDRRHAQGSLCGLPTRIRDTTLLSSGQEHAAGASVRWTPGLIREIIRLAPTRFAGNGRDDGQTLFALRAHSDCSHTVHRSCLFRARRPGRPRGNAEVEDVRCRKCVLGGDGTGEHAIWTDVLWRGPRAGCL